MLHSRLVCESFNVHNQWDNAIWNWIPYKLFIVRNNLILGQLATPFLVRFGIDLRSLQNLAFGLHHGRSLNIEAKHVEVFLNNISMAQRANRVDWPENHVLVSFLLLLSLASVSVRSCEDSFDYVHLSSSWTRSSSLRDLRQDDHTLEITSIFAC